MFPGGDFGELRTVWDGLIWGLGEVGIEGLGMSFDGFAVRDGEIPNCSTWNNLKSPVMTGG